MNTLIENGWFINSERAVYAVINGSAYKVDPTGTPLTNLPPGSYTQERLIRVLKLIEKAFNPDQPRVPAGTPEVGQFAGGGDGDGLAVGHTVAWQSDRGKLYLGKIISLSEAHAVVEVTEQGQRRGKLFSRTARYVVRRELLQIQKLPGEKAFNPDQPRVPRDVPEGGQFGEGGGSGSAELQNHFRKRQNLLPKKERAEKARAKKKTTPDQPRHPSGLANNPPKD